MGRANLIAELLKGKPVKKFVVVGEGNKKGQIGKQIHDLYGGAAVDIEFDDGYVLSCMLSDLRELDDSPIAAGDEVVCVDASHGAAGNQYLTVGKAYQVYRHNNFLTVMNDIGNHCQSVLDRFVKVKPLQAVKEDRPRIKQPMSTTTIGREFWMVKGFGPASYEHADYESALKEAERLAREHEGVPFTVMQSREVFCSGVVKFDPDFNRYTDTPF